MAEAIGALRADLTATSAQFASDMATARQSVISNTGPMNIAFLALGKTANQAIDQINLVRSAAVALATSGLAIAITKSIEFANQIGKTADKLGITTDALQELRFAAKLSGLGVDEFDSSFSKFEKTIGDANGGSVQAIKIFQGLGVSIAELKSKKPDEIFQIIADQLNKVTNASTRNAIANALFGKSWADIAPLLREGSAGIMAARTEAEKLGIVIDKSLIKQASQAADELDRAGAVLKSGLLVAALQFIPLIEKMSDIVTDQNFLTGLQTIANIIEAIVTVALKGVEAIGGLTRSLELFAKIPAMMDSKTGDQATMEAFAQMTDIFGLTKGGSGDGKDIEVPKPEANGRKLGDVNNIFGAQGTDIAKEIKGLNAETDQIQRSATLRRDYVNTIAEEKINIDLVNEAKKKNIDLSTKQGQAWATAFKTHAQTLQNYQDEEKILEDIKTPLQAYNDELTRLNELHELNFITNKEFNLELEKVHDRFVEAQSAVKGLAGAGKEMGDAFADSITGMIDSTDSFSATLYKLVQQIQAIAIKKSLTEPLGNAIGGGLTDILGGAGGGFSGLLGDLFGGGSSVYAPGAVGPFMPGAVGGFADGGTAFPGSTFWVGEQGPELMKLGASSATITPMDKMGGDSIYQIDARGTDAGVVRRVELALLNLAGPGQVEHRITDAKRRGALK